jgi:hypothetical protein
MAHRINPSQAQAAPIDRKAQQHYLQQSQSLSQRSWIGRPLPR